MRIDLPENGLRVVGEELDQSYFYKLSAFVDEERQYGAVYPLEIDVFAALKLTPFDRSPCPKAGDSWAEHCEPDRGRLPRPSYTFSGLLGIESAPQASIPVGPTVLLSYSASGRRKRKRRWTIPPQAYTPGSPSPNKMNRCVSSCSARTPIMSRDRRMACASRYGQVSHCRRRSRISSRSYGTTSAVTEDRPESPRLQAGDEWPCSLADTQSVRQNRESWISRRCARRSSTNSSPLPNRTGGWGLSCGGAASSIMRP